MHVLTVCYGHPADPAAFDTYYKSTHGPLVERSPAWPASPPATATRSMVRSRPPDTYLAFDAAAWFFTPMISVGAGAARSVRGSSDA